MVRRALKVISKLRHSRQRELIYSYVRASTAHPSADEVYNALKAEDPAISLGTVYRNLKLLESMGALRRVTTRQNVERYDATTADHAHFVCKECGGVTDLFDVDLGKIKKDNAPNCGSIAGVDLIFEGVCNACRSRDCGETI